MNFNLFVRLLIYSFYIKKYLWLPMKLWSKQSEIEHEPTKTAVNVPELWPNHNKHNFLSSTPKPKLEKQSWDYFFFAFGSQYISYNMPTIQTSSWESLVN